MNETVHALLIRYDASEVSSVVVIEAVISIWLVEVFELLRHWMVISP